MKKNLDDAVYEAMLASFLDGSFQADQKFIPGELTQQFGVSATPVLHALKRMVYEGLVTVKNGKYSIIHFSQEDFLKLCEVREIIELEALKRIVGALGPEVLERLGLYTKTMQDALDARTYTEFIKTDLEFHRTLVRLSGNPFLLDYYKNLQHKFLVYNFINVQTPDLKTQSTHEHIQLVQAIQDGALDTACAVMKCHIRHVSQRVFPKS